MGEPEGVPTFYDRAGNKLDPNAPIPEGGFVIRYETPEKKAEAKLERERRRPTGDATVDAIREVFGSPKEPSSALQDAPPKRSPLAGLKFRQSKVKLAPGSGLKGKSS